MTGKLLIAGVGNIFLGDDAFGVEVANRLAQAELPEWADVVDYGIRGMHLAYDLAGYDSLILVDATARGGAPGTIYVIEPESAPGPASAGPDSALSLAGSSLLNAHGMQPDVVLGLLSLFDAGTRRVLVVGCEPASLDYGIGLSEPVSAAVEEAAAVVLRLVADAAASGGDHHLVTKE